MKISCYNIGTKKKERNKKCFKLSNKEWRNANAQIRASRQGVDKVP